MTRHRRTVSFLAAALASAGLLACSDDNPDTSANSVEIVGAWARTSPMMVNVGAAYFQITSPVDDRLVAVSVDPSVAGMVEIHETVPAHGEDTAHGEDMTHGDGDGAAMTMREMANGLPLPAGETVPLEPGGYHLMLMELVEPLEVGDTVELVLSLETAGEVPVTVEVRDEAPAAP